MIIYLRKAIVSVGEPTLFGDDEEEYEIHGEFTRVVDYPFVPPAGLIIKNVDQDFEEEVTCVVWDECKSQFDACVAPYVMDDCDNLDTVRASLVAGGWQWNAYAGGDQEPFDLV